MAQTEIVSANLVEQSKCIWTGMYVHVGMFCLRELLALICVGSADYSSVRSRLRIDFEGIAQVNRTVQPNKTVVSSDFE